MPSNPTWEETTDAPAWDDTIEHRPLTPELMAAVLPQLQRQGEMQAAAAQMNAGKDEMLREVVNNPRDIPAALMGVATIPGRMAYAAAADVVSKVAGQPEYGGNILYGPSLRGQQMPVDRFLAETSKTNPNATVAVKTAKALAEMSPLMAVGMLPAGTQKLLAAGFTVDMLAHAPAQFAEYADEINKPIEEQDADKLTTLKSGIIQTFGFAPVGAAFAVKGVPAEIGYALDVARGNVATGGGAARAASRPGAARPVLPAEEGATVPTWEATEMVKPTPETSNIQRPTSNVQSETISPAETTKPTSATAAAPKAEPAQRAPVVPPEQSGPPQVLFRQGQRVRSGSIEGNLAIYDNGRLAIRTDKGSEFPAVLGRLESVAETPVYPKAEPAQRATVVPPETVKAPVKNVRKGSGVEPTPATSLGQAKPPVVPPETPSGVATAEPAGTSAMGFPMESPVPPTPAPAPAPGVTMIQHGRLPVTLDRTGPGSVSVPQIMDSLRNVLRVSGSDAGLIRTGNFTQRALGIWKPHEEIIRLAAADNLPTATHEVGHGLQQMVYGTAKASGLKFLSPEIRRELVGMGKALYGSRKPVAGYSGEGFAEFMRYWLTTEDAPRVAPKLTEFFEKTFLPSHPEIAKALQQSRDLVTTWRQQGSAERASRQLVREPGALKRTLESLGKLVNYQGLFESAAPIEAVSKAAAKKLGRPLPPAQDPFKLFSWKRGTAGATVERMVMEHMLDVWGNPVGAPLADAFALVKGQRQEALLYLFGKVAEMRWKQGKNPGIPLEDAKFIRTQYESPNMQLFADKYFQWWDQLLDYVVQADPSMTESVARMRAANPYYAPLARMIDPVAAKATAAKAGSNPFFKMTGSGLPVKDIFDQTFINAARLVNRANRAMVTQSIVKLADIQGLGHIVEEIPRAKVQEKVNIEQVRRQLEDLGADVSMISPDEMLEYYSMADLPKGSAPIISVKDAAGQTRWFEVDARLYDTLEGLQKFSLKSIPMLGPVLDLVLGAPARMFRLGTTGLRPSFSLVTNPSRDIASLLAQTSVNPAKVAALYPAALKEAVVGGPYKNAFLDLAANMGQPLGLDIGHTKRVSKELFHGRIMRVVTNPIDHLRELLSITESAPRIAELRAVADEIGWKPGKPMTPDQAVQLGLAAKRVTVDFSAAGDFSRVANEAIPFFNPAVQGLRSFARAFKNNPTKATLTGAALFTAPALAMWWMNKDKDWYKALPWRERYLYTNIDDGTNVWRIPRPFEWGNVFMVLPEALMDSWYRHDPEAAKQAVGHIFASVNPVDYPVLAKMAKEQWENRIDFWDRPIIPRSEMDLPPSEQVGPYTSKLAVGINKVFPNVSPRRLDVAIRSYFGGLGPDVLDIVGLGSAKGDREWEASDIPVLGTLFRRGGEFNAQNQQVLDFWDKYLESKSRMDGFNFARSQAEKGLRDPNSIQPPAYSDVAAASIGEDASKAIRLLQQMAARTKETKARAELYRQAGEIARDALEAMNNAANGEKQSKAPAGVTNTLLRAVSK
jgi:hypothetical protein